MELKLLRGSRLSFELYQTLVEVEDVERCDLSSLSRSLLFDPCFLNSDGMILKHCLELIEFLSVDDCVSGYQALP